MAVFYREGAIGGLLDEYERAILDLQRVISRIPDQELTILIDAKTTDQNCKTLQSILSHVVSSGYGYATSIHNLKGKKMERPVKIFHVTTEAYIKDLTNVFAFTEQVFSQLNDIDLEEFDDLLKIRSGWGQVYDIEQMTEHAIVHVLRHRRQIEKLMA